MAWRIECKPEGHNPGTEDGRNEGGMVVYVVAGGGGREEIGRVAFERNNSTHPDVTYGDQLSTFMDAARETIAMIGDLQAEAGVLQ